MNSKSVTLWLGMLLLGAQIFLMCGDPVAGSGTETENPSSITGVAVYPGGDPVANATVSVREKDFLQDTSQIAAKAMSSALSRQSRTNDLGQYFVDSIFAGEYLVEINDGKSFAALQGVVVEKGKDSIPLPADTLLPTQTVSGTVNLSGTNANISTYVIVKGAGRAAKVDSSGHFELNDVPEGNYTLHVVTSNSEMEPVESPDVKVTHQQSLVVSIVDSSAGSASITGEIQE